MALPDPAVAKGLKGSGCGALGAAALLQGEGRDRLDT